MQPKFIARLALQVSLTLSLLTTGVLMSLALAGEFHPDLQSPTRLAGFPEPPRRPFPELEGIDLTAQQQEQMAKIREEMRPQWESIAPRPQLTSEQQSQWDACQALQRTLPQPPPLTAEQKTQLQQLMQTYFQKIEAILTASQREQFRQNQERMRSLMRPHEPR